MSAAIVMGLGEARDALDDASEHVLQLVELVERLLQHDGDLSPNDALAFAREYGLGALQAHRVARRRCASTAARLVGAPTRDERDQEKRETLARNQTAYDVRNPPAHRTLAPGQSVAPFGR